MDAAFAALTSEEIARRLDIELKTAREKLTTEKLRRDSFQVAILWRLLQAFSARDAVAVSEWTERFIAARDTAEFGAETIQMGYSLWKLITDLKIADDA